MKHSIPKLYKKQNIWYCQYNTIIGTGTNPKQAYIDFIIKRAFEFYLHD
jgi:hypothetical protein